LHAAQLVELLFRCLRERRGDPGPGIVDKVVEPLAAPGLAERAPDAGGEAGEGRDVAGVQAEGERRASERLDLGDGDVRFCTIRVVGDDEVDAALGEAYGSVAAEAAARAGDDRYLCRCCVCVFVGNDGLPKLSGETMLCPRAPSEECRNSRI